MLSKRLNDIIFASIIMLVVIAVFIARFFILGLFDDRIERIEEENTRLEDQLAENQQLIRDYRDEALPSQAELHRYIPSSYAEDRLLYYVYAQLELNDIQDVAERSLSVDIHDDPTYPENTDFRTYADQYDAKRVYIAFETDDTSEARDLVTHMQDLDQLFILQNVRYDIPRSGERVEVEINFTTFYHPAD